MNEAEAKGVERQKMDVDIVCVGFGPAMGGFLTHLSRGLVNSDGTPAAESEVSPGMPPQVICYERADDVGFGVSGVVTKARSIRESFPDFDPSQVPTCCAVKQEKVLYLLDPGNASRRSVLLKAADAAIRALGKVLPYEDYALSLPYIPPFLRKEPGLAFSIGQFTQWVAGQVMSSGAVQIWPGTPVSGLLTESGRVTGVRLMDQGTDRKGNPEANYMPGMDISSRIVVVGDGPVGPVGKEIDGARGLPAGNHRRDWALGMKFVVNLRHDSGLEAGTVLHTFGFPEPEIFGFMYVFPDDVASLGIFVPATLDNPVRAAYRYLQHWMLHPYLWRHLKGGTLRSWGAKSLQESGKRGEPYLAGDGYVRIGEGSGSTNVLTGSGVDEAWMTGALLGDGVAKLLRERKPLTRENIEEAYVKPRRAGRLEKEARQAAKARDGFTLGFTAGMIGMGLAGFTKGLLNMPGRSVPPHARLPEVEEYFKGRIPAAEIEAIRKECWSKGEGLHDKLMERAGWPPIPFDGSLLVSHQDALLMGGKVQAAAGYADHVVFTDPETCRECRNKICIEMCSAQAITPGEGGVPAFDREKCVHCGACWWNCSRPRAGDPELSNVDFRAGSGGLHSSEN